MTLLSAIEKKKGKKKGNDCIQNLCSGLIYAIFVFGHILNKILIFSNLFHIYLANYKGAGNLLQITCMMLVSTS